MINLRTDEIPLKEIQYTLGEHQRDVFQWWILNYLRHESLIHALSRFDAFERRTANTLRFGDITIDPRTK